MLTDVRSFAALLAVLPLTGCGAGYLLQAAQGQYEIVAEREPIDAVIADPATTPELRVQLDRARVIRNFATDELDLPDNGSYRSYADIDRAYVVWNVVAAPALSVDPKEWCFLIVGCVSYRGYFSESRARAYAASLSGDGYDVVVGGVQAYSTLGRFADPVLSSMLGRGVDDLAAVVFHELAHQVVYVPGDSAFNEAFAVMVEQAGLARWLAAQGRPEALATWQKRRAQQAEVAALFAATRAQLRAVYASSLDDATKLTRKQALMDELAAELRAFEARHGLVTGYRAWLATGLNNAHIASVATYFGCVPGFERLLAREGGDLPRFYAAVKALAAEDAQARRAAVCVPATASSERGMIPSR
jgi:predicted aminopeptidase